MFSLILIWLIVAAMAAAYIYLLYSSWTRVPRRDIDDVVPFLHAVDQSLIEELLDPAVDHTLRWRLGPRAFRDTQLRRVRIYRELVLRMDHNARVIAEFARSRYGVSESPAPAPGSRLESAWATVLVYSASARVRVHIWLSLPLDFLLLIPTPDLARLRRAGGVDGLKAYEELRTAALEAFAQLRPDELEALNRGL
jgi:hypothetical protein